MYNVKWYRDINMRCTGEPYKYGVKLANDSTKHITDYNKGKQNKSFHKLELIESRSN